MVRRGSSGVRSSCQSADIPLRYLHFPENTSVTFSLLLKNAVQHLMQFSEYVCNLATSFIGGHKSLFLFKCFPHSWMVRGFSCVCLSTNDWQQIICTFVDDCGIPKAETENLIVVLNPVLWNIAQERCAFMSKGVIRDLKGQLVCLGVVLMESVANCQDLCVSRTPG